MTILISHQAAPPPILQQNCAHTCTPLVTGLIKNKKFSFSEMLRRELYLWPLAKKLYHGWTNTMTSSKVHENCPPRNEEFVAPLVDTSTICCFHEIFCEFMPIKAGLHNAWWSKVKRNSLFVLLSRNWSVTSLDHAQVADFQGVFCPNRTNSFTIISGNLLHRINQKRKNKVISNM